MSSLAARRRRHLEDEPGQMCIPGLGENKPRPRELGCSFFGYIPDAYSNNLPLLPSESSHSPRSGNSSVRNITSEDSSRSASPRAGDDMFGRKARPRTAHVSDSSQLRMTLWQPPSPDNDQRREVEEELCVAVDARNSAATPFFDHQSGKILIRGGTVVNDGTVTECDVLIDTSEGVIVEVGAGLDAPEDCKIIDATDKFILPGGIDFSTTLHDPTDDENLPLADNFDSGSRAALSGGTTLIVDNVTPKKGQSLVEAFQEWKEDANETCHCDFAPVVVVTTWNEQTKDDMTELVKHHSVNTFKVFMAYKDKMLNDKELLEVFDHCKSLGAIVQVHAENGEVILENEKRLLARGVTGPEGHLMARPEELEEEAVKRVCSLAKISNVPIIICGPTSKQALEIIKNEREKGQVVLGMPTAASLALDGSHYFNDCWEHSAAFVTSPPLRDDPDISDIITAAVADDDYQIVCSNNRTYSTDVKALGKGDFTSIPHGINGIEDRLSVVWQKIVQDGKKGMERFVAVTSTNPAKALGIYPKKGCIEAGADADIIVWNPNNLKSISKRTHLQSVDFNVFEGLKTHGAPEFVLIAGRVAVYEYEVSHVVKANSGKGKLVATPQFPENLYDSVQNLDERNKVASVIREATPSGSDRVDGEKQEKNFGLTTPRNWGLAEEPVLNKRLGVYQRPMSAHGIRNQQDSTFSLAGGYGPEELQGSPRRTVRVNAPPGGGASGFW